jgi:glyoxylase-like metal-dependent hydrolase (beta-lactamase superfamily II)
VVSHLDDADLRRHDAVLVDPPFTTDATREVLAWVDKTGRDVTELYVTHGHGDHWLGVSVLLERFPDAVVRATVGTRAQMAGLATAESRGPFWDVLFPGRIPRASVDVQVVAGEGLSLEVVQVPTCSIALPSWPGLFSWHVATLLAGGRILRPALSRA